MWKLEINREDNGYTLNGKFRDSDIVSTMVIEETNDELEVHEKLLWNIMEYFAFSGSKHDDERIRVVREKQEIKLPR